jgi:exopolysaccharide biosynthesis polyprenyl glycosylphosphotransferase
VVDLAAIMAALVLATITRFGGQTLGRPGPYGRWLALWLPLWWLGLVAVGLYDQRRTHNPVEELTRITRGVTLGAAAAVFVSFSADFPLSRGWILVGWALALVGVAVGRRLLRRTISALRARGHLRHRALVIGADASGWALAQAAARALGEGLDVVGLVRMGAPSDDPALEGMVVGGVERLRDLVSALRVSEVLVAPTVDSDADLSRIVSTLDGVPVHLYIAPALEGFLASRLTIHPLGDRPLVSIERIELRPMARVVKRAVDLALGSALLVLSLPVLAACAAAIRLSSPGPVLFRQRRVGLGGREFTMWKLRTMMADAEMPPPDLARSNQASGLLFKLERDPRVTQVGRFLRRSSLDELPQLLNVVAGQMSLVGPRPPLPSEVAHYDNRLGRRLLVKPGMTGLWQVNGRSLLSFEDYVRYDLLYVQNWSLALDLYILARTVPAVLLRRGAY